MCSKLRVGLPWSTQGEKRAPAGVKQREPEVCSSLSGLVPRNETWRRLLKTPYHSAYGVRTSGLITGRVPDPASSNTKT